MVNHSRFINNFEINPVGIGTWLMGGGMFEDRTCFATYERDEQEVEALKYSISKGQNHIDTAQYYSVGHTEELVGRAIAGFDRSRLFLASKVWKSHASRGAVPRAVEAMLSRLGTDYLDLLYMHAPWPEVSIRDCLLGICDCIDRKLVRAIGVSNFNLEQLKEAMSVSRYRISALQNLYNLLERKAPAELREYCVEHGVTLVAYRPVERRKLADLNTNPVVAGIARKAGGSIAQVAINWLIRQPGVVAIPKASRLEHIDENLGALNLTINEEDRQALEEIS